jgi:hypothetical protein
MSGIRTRDPSVRAGEDGSCIRQRGHYDRQYIINIIYTTMTIIPLMRLNDTYEIRFLNRMFVI